MEWISTQDKPPREGEHVLLYDGYEKICVGYVTQFCGYNHHPMGDCATGAPLFRVSHWMPLPECPEPAKETDG